MRNRPLPNAAVFYARCSTEDQRLSPAAQRQQAEQWAAQNGVTIVSAHVDAGVSGGSDLAERPALAEALGAIKAHRAGILLVVRIDRIARDVAIYATVERAVSKLGAKIQCADGTGNGGTDADGFMRNVLAAAAQYERSLIRSRTRAALAAKKAKGERVGEIPFGFSCIEGKLVANHTEQATVARAVALRAAAVSLRGIVETLAAEGHVSRTGRALGLTQVVRALQKAPAQIPSAAMSAAG